MNVFEALELFYQMAVFLGGVVSSSGTVPTGEGRTWRLPAFRPVPATPAPRLRVFLGRSRGRGPLELLMFYEMEAEGTAARVAGWRWWFPWQWARHWLELPRSPSVSFSL